MSEDSARATHSAVVQLDIGSATDVGRIREANEDALLVVQPDGARAGQVIVAVADGMGGHKAGEVAADLAIQSLRRAIDDVEPTAPGDMLLRSAVELGNRTILQAAAEDAAKDGMGTTLVCALVDRDGGAVIANVGDSRAYSVIGGNARLVTVDHTWVNQQVLSGLMSEREARDSPFRNLLTRSLGSTPRVEIDFFSEVRLGPRDALVLVSDGVTGYLDERDFTTIMREAGSAQDAAERLVEEAVERGGADNATAVVVRRSA